MPDVVLTNPVLRTLHANRGMIFPISCVGLLLVLLAPLPTGVLDLLLAANIALSVLVLVTTIYVKSPLEFAVFPSVLLAITLFRLVLNVATTRLILTADRFGDLASAQHAAGEVVLAFANFVASDALVVGVIIFLIIFVIQFVVITKGASRISEVAARFTLDAMPGRQMAIDADLGAGLITEAAARQRREEISQQADFYGAMDGASKFVRGDAIAGVVITFINILGGLYIGMMQGWPLAKCAMVFTRLTIGDGLVSQVPAFVVSLGAGLIVTRSSSKTDLGDQVVSQMLARPKALMIAAVFLMLLSLTGLPALPLLVLGSGCAAVAYFVNRRERTAAAIVQESEKSAEPEQVEKLLELDAMELEIGPGLVKLADELMAGIAGIRRQVATELGMIVPAVRVHDNPELAANDYVIRIKGHKIALGVTYPEQFLAVKGELTTGNMADAEATIEPVSGTPAYWITESQLSAAEAQRYKIVEAKAVLMGHLAETIRAHAHELLTRQEVRNLLDNLRQCAAALVDELIPSQLKPGELHRVLQNLLRERVSIRDLETILETLADHAVRTKDVDALTERVRHALARSICRQYTDGENRLNCLMLQPALEDLIVDHSDAEHPSAAPGLEPQTVQRLIEQLQCRTNELSKSGRAAVLLCSPHIRAPLRRLTEISLPQIAVLSFTEVSPDVAVEAVGLIGVDR